MRSSETQTLDAGTIIASWPASTGGGGEINLSVDPPFVVPATSAYLIETDTDAGTVTFRRIPGPPASDEHVEGMFEAHKDIEDARRRRRRGDA